MKFRTSVPYGDQQVLSCPVCGEDYTHISSVSVFARREDADNGLTVCVNDIDCYGSVKAPTASITPSMAGNASARRGSVLIAFKCEMCHNQTTVAFAQHKGYTEIAVVDCHAIDFDE